MEHFLKSSMLIASAGHSSGQDTHAIWTNDETAESPQNATLSNSLHSLQSQFQNRTVRLNCAFRFGPALQAHTPGAVCHNSNQKAVNIHNELLQMPPTQLLKQSLAPFSYCLIPGHLFLHSEHNFWMFHHKSRFTHPLKIPVIQDKAVVQTTIRQCIQTWSHPPRPQVFKPVVVFRYQNWLIIRPLIHWTASLLNYSRKKQTKMWAQTSISTHGHWILRMELFTYDIFLLHTEA